jgi:Icc-related predicted phosphoesterase
VGRFTLFFATDIHGSDVCFRKFLNAAAAYDADAIIMGGDVCGKQIVPIMQSDTGYYADVFGDTITVSGGDVGALVKRIRDAAAYPFVTTAEDWQLVVGDQVEEHRLFTSLSCDLIEEWTALATDRLGGTKVRCLIGAGNDDPPEIDEILRASSYVEVPDWDVVDLNGFPLLTVCESNPTPWNSPRELTEDEYRARFAPYASQVADCERAIFNLHVPPYGSGLDNAPEIDADFQVQYAGAEMKVRPVGSTAVRSAIETFQPLLGLHGHVHESPGQARIGRTTCLNPGSDYIQRFLRGVLVSLDTRKGIRGYHFTVG